jgi:flagellin FlaB
VGDTVLTGIGLRRGLTGLEVSIILVAFVITASAFAYMVLNVGFLTAEKAQSVISSGISEASSVLYLDSDVIGSFTNNSGSQSDICLTSIVFYVRLGQGDSPISLSDSKLVITYTNARCHASVYDSNGTITTVTGVTGDGDDVIEQGERFKVSIDLTELDKAGVEPAQSSQPDVYVHPHEEIRIEVRPSDGAVLIIERTLPQIAHSVQAF